MESYVECIHDDSHKKCMSIRESTVVLHNDLFLFLCIETKFIIVVKTSIWKILYLRDLTYKIGGHIAKQSNKHSKNQNYKN
jgi:hypothetical protein